MANELTFGQLSTILNSIYNQATGRAALTVTDTNSFVSVATTTLQTGYDNVINAISQVLSRTIFSIRPYNARFRGLMVDNQRYGNHVRKINYADKPFENDARIPLTDGVSVDQQVVNKPDVVQTNWYGTQAYEKSLTIFRDQLDVAFSGPDEFGRFVSGTLSNVSDMLEQAREVTARMILANMICGLSLNKGDNVIHLLTEYNTLTGQELTDTTVYDPANYPSFMKWVYGRVADLSDLMQDRSMIFHQTINGKPIMRHTPYARQRVYLYSKEQYSYTANVLSDVYHDNFIRYAEYQPVSFWQSIETRDTVNTTPSIMQENGVVVQAGNTTVDKIFGIIMDEEFCGYTTVNQWSAPAPFNAKGGYSNTFWHETHRYWGDYTENAVLLLLD